MYPKHLKHFTWHVLINYTCKDKYMYNQWLVIKIKFVSNQPLNTCITPLLEFYLAPYIQDLLALNPSTPQALHLY